jgi:ADP-ribosylglycohydrolase
VVTISDKVSGAVWGLLTGDALGVPYEFAPPQRIPRADRIEFQPPRDFVRSHSHVPPGTWSDDGAQALCLLSSLLDNKRLDPQDLMERIDLWFRRGLYALDKDVFDIGLQTRQALDRFAKGKPALECGSTGEWANGNGSLMRVLPLALWHRGSDRELVEDSVLQSRTTHAHPRSTMCCAFYCLWARGIIAEAPDPWTQAAEILEGMFPPGTPERRELDEAIRPRERMEAKGKGYVVDTLWTARQCMEAGDYEAVVRAAISLGNDTDTTACVVGGLAGLRDGVEGIPKRWFKALRGKEMVEPLLIRLTARLETVHKPI